MVEMYYILLHLGQSAQIREIQMYYFLLLFKAGVKQADFSVLHEDDKPKIIWAQF